MMISSAFLSYVTFYTTTLTTPFGDTTTVSSTADYVSSVYIFLISVAGVVSLGGIVYGGMLYTTSGGNSSRRDTGLKRIIESVIGLVILISASFILGIMNPSLIGLEDPDIPEDQSVEPGPDPWSAPPPSGPPPSTGPLPIP